MGVQQLVHEVQVQRAELERQAEELRQAQGEIDKSRGRYTDLYDVAPIGSFTVNQSGRIGEANLTGTRLWGGQPGTLMKSGEARGNH